MSTKWRDWCRLCAKEDSPGCINIFLDDKLPGVEENFDTDVHAATNSELAVTIQKYFSVHITAEQMLPKMICPECFTYVTTLVNYAERVAKVQDMFISLQLSTEANEPLDLPNVRHIFGLQDEAQEQVFMQHTLPVVLCQEGKPDQIDERVIGIISGGDNSSEITENPLESPHTTASSLVAPQSLIRKQSAEKSLKSQRTFKDVSKSSSIRLDIEGNHSSEAQQNFKNEISEAMEQIEADEVEDDPFLDDGFEPTEQLKEENLNCSNDHKRAAKRRNFNIVNTTSPKKLRRVSKNRSTKASMTKDATGDKARLNTLCCPHCPSKYMRIQNLHMHLKRTHNIADEALLKKCDQCPRTFTTEFQLRNHVKIHLPAELKKTIQCPHCDNRFSTNELLRSHIKFVHTDDRPFICEECGKAVRTNTALRTHMLTHTDDAPFECEICKKGFKDVRRLKKHSEIHDPKKHICTICGAELNSRATLNRHLLVHSDKLEHKCDYCGKEFRTAKSLKSHLILHTGLKPYACEFCERTFANGPNCRSHKKKAHPEELAALEAAGGGKTYTPNIPKLEVLRAVTKAADNLTPVATKKSGNFLHGNPSQKAAASSKSAKKKASAESPIESNSEEQNDLAVLHSCVPEYVLMGSPNDCAKLPVIKNIYS